MIEGTDSDRNKIKGNYIGLNTEGTAANGNKQNGIHILDGASDNIISGKTVKDRNIISGNDSIGVLIEGAGSDRNLVQGNYIGTGKRLLTEIPNIKYGIEINSSARNTVIGDSLDANAKNYIYNNKKGGLSIIGTGTNYTKVCHNRLANNGWYDILKDDVLFGIGMKEGCQYTLLYKNEIIHNVSHGVYIIDSDYNQFILNQIKETVKSNPKITDDGFGVKIVNGNYINLKNNIFENNKSTALILKNSSNNDVYENNFENNGYAGIDMCGHEFCGRNKVHSNIMRNNAHGICCKNGHTKNRIENNDIYNNENGIYIFSCDSNIVINNNIYGSNDSYSGYGIEVSFGKWHVIGNNQIHHNKCAGICFDRSSSNIIATNTIYSNGGGGIDAGGSDQNLVDSNEIKDNGNYGIGFGGNYNHIINNRLIGNSDTGIFIKGDENVVRNNNIDKTNSNAQRGAIFLDGAVRNKISGNHCHNTVNKGAGIFLYESSKNSISKNIFEENDGDGIHLQKNCSNNLIENNHIVSNNKAAVTMGAGYYGILFWKSSNYIVVRSNKIWYNCAGIKEKNSRCNAFINNSIHFNICFGTGIHIFGANSIISGNSIKGDNGVAIHCEDGATPKILNNFISENHGDGILTESSSLPLVYDNIIVGNHGYGLRNADSSVILQATNNWWGDASGPAGEGSGSGDEVAGSVDFSGWRLSPVSLVVSAFVNPFFTLSGVTDSVYCGFQNWENLNDVIDIIITDSLGWLIGSTDLTLAFSDSMGADTTIRFTIPTDLAVGTTYKVKIEATSQADPTVSDIDSFLIIVYSPNLVSIVLSPNTVQLRGGQTQLFNAQGYDSSGQAMNFNVSWSASGGEITNDGFFTAGSDTGTFIIIAADPVTDIQGTATVKIFPMLSRISISPDSAMIKPNQTQQFTAAGYDSVGSEVAVFALWEATGGTIDQTGLFTAGSDTGYFQVTAEDTLSRIYQTAVVHIKSITAVDLSNKPKLPRKFALGQNYPNPFNPETTIEFSVKEKCSVKLKIFDITGREVATLVNTNFETGFYRVTFDARNLATGVYLYRIQMKDFVDVKKMVLLE